MEGKMSKLKVVTLRAEPRVERMYSILRVLRFASVLAVFLVATGCGPRHYVAKANEEIYGTWTSTQRSPHKLVMLSDGTWEEYIYESDAAPTYKGTYQIIDKWKDAEGNVWYKEFVKLTFPTGTKEMTQELDRIDRLGHVWEFDFDYVSHYDPLNFPKEINPKGYNYGIYKRSGK
jgi:hypothetical protein